MKETIKFVVVEENKILGAFITRTYKDVRMVYDKDNCILEITSENLEQFNKAVMMIKIANKLI